MWATCCPTAATDSSSGSGSLSGPKRDAMKAGAAGPPWWTSREIGTSNGHAPEWQDLPADSFVHGCLTEWGTYAVYEANVCLVGCRPPGPILPD